MKVLIADDSATSRAVLRKSLAKWGYEVVMAEDGAEALTILERPDAPPMAILDWIMPHLTGPEVCRKVRETRREPYTYILLLTSKNSQEEIVEGLEAGADDYIIKPFNQQELHVRLRAGSRIIELQLSLMEAREEMREKANKDLLTKLHNRSAIMATLETEIARSHRDQRSVGLALLDIDHFKKVNDTYGHFAGDAVLRETASRLKSSMRAYDQVGRYGGEEFLVVLPNCDMEQAVQQADRMRMRLQESKILADAGVEIPVTASFGVTITDLSDRNPDVFIRVADEALYKAKANGRNRVESMYFREADSTAS